MGWVRGKRKGKEMWEGKGDGKGEGKGDIGKGSGRKGEIERVN